MSQWQAALGRENRHVSNHEAIAGSILECAEFRCGNPPRIRNL
jgi:hypothetical protein